MKTIIALFIAALPLLGQNPATCNTATIPICSSGSPSGAVQVKPQAVPTSTTAVTTYDAYLQTITISNPTAGAITFTLSDRQGSPIAAIPTVSIPANTVYVVVWPEGRSYWCPGGFTVSAGGAGLTFYGAFKQ
jgi:hypothetical protein